MVKHSFTVSCMPMQTMFLHALVVLPSASSSLFSLILVPSSSAPNQQPFFSYSAQDPMKFFALSVREREPGDQSGPLYIPYSGTVQWVASATAVSRPQLLDVLNSSVGLEQLIYLYAKVYAVNPLSKYLHGKPALSVDKPMMNTTTRSKVETRE